MGNIRTPNFPNLYPIAKEITWSLDLHPAAVVEFTRAVADAPSFEACCDDLKLYVAPSQVESFRFSTAGAGQVGSVLTQVKGGETGKLVSLKFTSDKWRPDKGILEDLASLSKIHEPVFE
jgi:hypothetical protein